MNAYQQDVVARYPRRKRFLAIGATIIAICISAFSAPAFAEDKVTTVTFWELTGHAKDLMIELVNHFNATIGKEKGIVIEFVDHERKYDQILSMALDEGSLPDILNHRPLLIPALLKKDVLIPLEELPGGKEFLADYQARAPFLMPGLHIINGKAYAVSSRFTTLRLAYNADLFVKAGIVDAAGNPKPPTTWAEVREDAKKIAALAPGKTFGIIFPMKGSATGEYTYFWEWKCVKPFIASIGHYYFDHANGRYNFSAFAPAIELVMQLKADGSIVPGELFISDDAARIKFGQEGNIGMYISASWDVGVFNDQFPAKIDWRIAPIPVLNAAQRYKDIGVGSQGYVISRNAAQKDLNNVMEVYKYLHSDYWETHMYEESKFIPTRSGIVEHAQKQPNKKGWKEFAETAEIAALPSAPDADITIQGLPWYQVFQNIYDGRVEMKAALADLDQRYNAAYQEAVKQGHVDPAKYQIPTFSLKQAE